MVVVFVVEPTFMKSVYQSLYKPKNYDQNDGSTFQNVCVINFFLLFNISPDFFLYHDTIYSCSYCFGHSGNYCLCSLYYIL